MKPQSFEFGSVSAKMCIDLGAVGDVVGYGSVDLLERKRVIVSTMVSVERPLRKS